MAKSKKQKTTSCQPQMGAYKHFVNDMCEALQLIKVIGNYSDLTNDFKRKAFDYKITICSSTAGNEMITSGELKSFTEKLKKHYREKVIELGPYFVSNYQLHLLHAFSSARLAEVQKQIGDDYHPNVVTVMQTKDILFNAFITQLFMFFVKEVTRMSTPDRKYYGAYFRLAPIYKKNPKLDFTSDLFGFNAQICLISINGQKRPAYRLAKPLFLLATPISWISSDVSLLGKFYSGNKKTLDVYIQSHALSRLKERLDLLDQEAINYALWENTNDIKEFVTYHGYLLLPFKVFGIKTGYLVASVTDDKLLFRTFLFITHNSSPEGDRLRKLSGLGKEDIRYWKIDRLSTFVNLDVEKYPGLIQLFRKAGLETLFDLRSKEFTSDLMQTANLDGLLEYIDRGKCECKLMNLSLDTLVSELELSGLK